jgi:hypothetical protein
MLATTCGGTNLDVSITTLLVITMYLLAYPNNIVYCRRYRAKQFFELCRMEEQFTGGIGYSLYKNMWNSKGCWEQWENEWVFIESNKPPVLFLILFLVAWFYTLDCEVVFLVYNHNKDTRVHPNLWIFRILDSASDRWYSGHFLMALLLYGAHRSLCIPSLIYN